MFPHVRPPSHRMVFCLYVISDISCLVPGPDCGALQEEGGGREADGGDSEGAVMRVPTMEKHPTGPEHTHTG